MATDIKLDQQDGSWVVVDSAVLKTTATDLIIDAPSRRGNRPGPHRRALVHDAQDGLTINFNGELFAGVADLTNVFEFLIDFRKCLRSFETHVAEIVNRIAETCDALGYTRDAQRSRTDIDAGHARAIAKRHAKKA